MAGRERVYKGNVRSYIAGLLNRERNATRVAKILNAPKRSKLAQRRSVKTVPRPLGISVPTITLIAKENHIRLTRGRPIKEAKNA